MEELFHPPSQIDLGAQLSLYACSTCTRRKVKCDKSTPACSACRKSRLDCRYIDAQSSKKRRRPPSDYPAKLQNARDGSRPPSPPKTRSEELFGVLVSNPKSGKTRYVHSNIWTSLGDDLHPSSDEETEEVLENIRGAVPSAGSVQLAVRQPPVDLRSAHKHVTKLWFFYVQNVDPICKLVHVPTVAKTLERYATDSTSVTKFEECLLLSILHIAVLSTSESDCANSFGCAKAELRQCYHDATRSALAKCSLLRTTKLGILQAYALLLVSLRDMCDAPTFWIETGIALRLAQRMGLHCNAANAARGPFEDQMRRRLWWQVMVLDKIAAQLAGTGMAVAETAWDTEVPLNVNDDDIWPAMSSPPVERKSATDMYFFMGRMEIGRTLMVKSPVETWHSKRKNWETLASAIDELEDRLESQYIRYCDCSIPYHVLAITMTRGTMNYCRLRLLILQAQGEDSSEAFTPANFSADQRREVVKLASRVVDQYIACHSNSAVQRYSWHLDSSLQWDPLIWVLHELCHEDPQLDIYAAWQRVSDMFEHNPIILEQKRILDIAVGRLVLKAWASTQNRKNNSIVLSEPAYIPKLEEAFSRRKAARGLTTSSSIDATTHDPMVLDELAGEAADFGIDWAFWDNYLHTKELEF